jgi:4-amino-4-deoxy-L-arabinose transferase-like glycosyltransferase
MLAAQSLFVLVLLAVCSFAPGFFFVRHLRWSPLEKLCGSIGLSLILLYLAVWAVFLSTSGNPAPYYFGISALCILAAMAARRDLVRLLQAQQLRSGLVGFGFLLLWTLLILAMIRNYSGADWRDDWLEHFQRSLFFLHHFPIDTQFIGHYILPARPPLMNVLADFFFGQTADRFEISQIVFLFLNLLLFLACFLIMPVLATGRSHRRSRALPLVAIFAMNPVVMQNATYAWTKALTAFFVVLGLWFYLAAIRKNDSTRLVAAFLAMAAGVLTHYSAGPYVVLVALHYLLVEFRRRSCEFQELAVTAALCSLLLFPWFAWSLKAYGLHATFASNTTVTSTEKYEGGNLQKISANLFDSIIPTIVRNPSSIHAFDQPNRAGLIRDNIFIFYQANLIFAMGLTGGLLVLWMFDNLLRSQQSRPQRLFWLVFVVGSLILGMIVVGDRNILGSAHLTLLPLEVLGLTWLASVFPSSRTLAIIIVGGLCLDFIFGVFLQARVQNLENSQQHTYFTGLSYGNGQFALGAPNGDSLTLVAWDNWMQKHKVALCREWLAQLEQQRGDSPKFADALAQIRARIRSMSDEDASVWQGWYGRHEGSISFFGDMFGRAWVPAGLLLGLWIGLLWILWQRLPPVTVADAATAVGNGGLLCGAVAATSAICLFRNAVVYLSEGATGTGVATLVVALASAFTAGYFISHHFSAS